MMVDRKLFEISFTKTTTEFRNARNKWRACNLSHQLESRLCRWLLQVIDNSDEPSIVITQDNLAQMLGVNRARLNEALKSLHAVDAVAQTHEAC